MEKMHILALVVTVLMVQLVVSAFGGGPINFEILLKTTIISALVGAIVFAFDKWLWRIPILYGWFVFAPDINGKWNVSGSIWNPITKKEEKALSGQMQIVQTFFSISFEINWHDHGVSKATAPQKFVVGKDGMCAFSTIYRFQHSTKANVERLHKAGVYFDSDTQKPSVITWRYSTSDQQLGVLHLSLVEQ
jgi:hypothetical protein